MTVPRDLADVINVVCDGIERYTGVGAYVFDEAGLKHPYIERHANHAAALDDRANLLVAELALVWHEGAAVVVTGDHHPCKNLQRFPEAPIREVGEIENHADFSHPTQQRLSIGG